VTTNSSQLLPKMRFIPSHSCWHKNSEVGTSLRFETLVKAKTLSVNETCYVPLLLVFLIKTLLTPQFAVTWISFLLSHRYLLTFLSFLCYKVVQIWPGQIVTSLHTIIPGHIWTTLYLPLISISSVVLHTLLFLSFPHFWFPFHYNLAFSSFSFSFYAPPYWALSLFQPRYESTHRISLRVNHLTK
jgi:hypothetical protein